MCNPRRAENANVSHPYQSLDKVRCEHHSVIANWRYFVLRVFARAKIMPCKILQCSAYKIDGGLVCACSKVLQIGSIPYLFSQDLGRR